MIWFFLLPLGVAIAGFLVFEHSQDELAILSAVVALGGLIISLILAPWQIQIAVLAIASLMSQRVVRSRLNGTELESYDDLLTRLYKGHTNRHEHW